MHDEQQSKACFILTTKQLLKSILNIGIFVLL